MLFPLNLRPHPSPTRPRKRSRVVPGRWAASPGVLAPTNATTSGAPCCRRADPKVDSYGRGSPNPHRCRPQGSCPSRRFRLFMLAARSGPLRIPPCAVAPDASRPCFMPLASLELPSRAFPSRGAVPTLAGLCFLALSSPITAGAEPSGVHDRFRRCAKLFARTTLPEEDRGRMSQGQGFPATARPAVVTCP
jgi:hypothetical protein